MTDMNVMCTRNGVPLDDIDCSLLRAWKIERSIDTAKGQMSFPINDSKATERNLRYMNLLMSMSDQTGIPNWCGFLWPDPGKVEMGELSLQLLSSESLLGTRVTPQYALYKGTPGQIFTALLNAAQKKAPLPISSNYGNIDTTYGKAQSLVYNLADIYRAANDLANKTNSIWYFDPQWDATTNSVTLVPYWRQRGVTANPIYLVEGGNLIVTSIDEKASTAGNSNRIANSITGYARKSGSSGTSGSDILVYTAQDQTSIGLYGCIEDSLSVLNAASVNDLVAPANSALLQRANPQITVNGYITGAPFPRAGDIVKMEFTNLHGYMITRRATNVLTMYVSSCSYSPDDNMLALIAKEYFGN